MKMRSFEDLIVWQKGHEFVLEIYKTSRCWPVEEKFGLINQIRRCSSSICANIVEGYSRTGKEFLRYLNISRGSLEESKYFLMLSRDLNYIDNEKFENLFNKAERIGKLIQGLSKSIKI